MKLEDQLISVKLQLKEEKLKKYGKDINKQDNFVKEYNMINNNNSSINNNNNSGNKNYRH